MRPFFNWSFLRSGLRSAGRFATSRCPPDFSRLREVGLCQRASFLPSLIVLFSGARLQSWDWHQFVRQRGGARLSHGYERQQTGTAADERRLISMKLCSSELTAASKAELVPAVCSQPARPRSGLGSSLLCLRHSAKRVIEVMKWLKLSRREYLMCRCTSCDVVYFKQLDVSGLCCDELPACVWLSRVPSIRRWLSETSGTCFICACIHHFNFIKPLC